MKIATQTKIELQAEIRRMRNLSARIGDEDSRAAQIVREEVAYLERVHVALFAVEYSVVA